MQNKFIFVIIIIVILFIIYLYFREDQTRNLISSRIDGLSKEGIDSINKLQSDYEKSNIDISNKYNQLMAKIVLLENSKFEEQASEKIGKKFEELDIKFANVKSEYDRSLLQNSNTLYTKIKEEIGTLSSSIVSEDFIKKIVSEHTADFNKNNMFLINTLSEYREDSELKFANLSKIIKDNKDQTDVEITEILKESSNMSDIKNNIDNYLNSSSTAINDLKLKLDKYANEQVEFTEKIQDKLSELDLNREDIKTLKGKIVNIQSMIDKLDNNSAITSALDNVSISLGSIDKLKTTHIFIRQINKTVRDIQTSINKFSNDEISGEISGEILNACNTYLVRYGVSNYANYVEFEDINKLLISIRMAILQAYEGSDSLNNTELRDFLNYTIKNDLDLLDVTPNDIENNTVSSSIIDVQKSISDIMKDGTPIKSDLIILKTKLNAMSDIIGSYPFSGSKKSVSDVLLEMNKKLDGVIDRIGTGVDVGDVGDGVGSITEDIRDMYIKINKLSKDVSDLFNKNELIEDLKIQLEYVKKSIGTYSGSADISSALLNLQTALDKNYEDTKTITNSLNDIKNVIGNHTADVNNTDLSSSVRNLLSTMSQIQLYIGNYKKDNRYSDIADAINQLYTKVSSLNSNVSTDNLKYSLSSLEVRFNELSGVIGNNGRFSFDNTMLKYFNVLDDKFNKLYDTIGKMSYPYGATVSDSIGSIYKILGNVNIDHGTIEERITTIKSSLDKLLNVVGEENSGLVSAIKSMSESLTTNSINYNAMDANIKTIVKEIDSFKSNNNLVLDSIENLKKSIEENKESQNYIVKFIETTISSKLDDLGKVLDLISYGTIATNIIKSSNALSSQLNKMPHIMANINYDPYQLINELTKIAEIMPMFDPGKLNSSIFKQINSTNEELQLFYLKTKEFMEEGERLSIENMKPNGVRTYNTSTTLYDSLSKPLLDYIRDINSLLGSKENPSIFNITNSMNNSIIKYGDDINSLRKNIAFVGEYVGSLDSPDMASAIRKLEKSYSYIGEYPATSLNPNISIAIANLQKAIGSYTTSTNIVKSIDNLIYVLGNYSSTETNPTISDAISNLQKDLDFEKKESDVIKVSVTDINKYIQQFNKSIGEFVSIDGSTISSHILSLEESSKYIGKYVPDKENPDITTAITNIQQQVSKLKEKSAIYQFEEIISHSRNILVRVDNKAMLDSWFDRFGGLRAGAITLIDLINQLILLSTKYNPNSVNFSINKQLSDLLKHCIFVRDTITEDRNETFAEMYGIVSVNNLLINSIQKYIENSIESTIIQVQESLNISNSNITKLNSDLGNIGDVGGKSILDMKTLIPGTISSLDRIIRTYTNGLNVRAKELQDSLTNLLISLEGYSSNSLNAEVYNNLVIVRSLIRGSFDGSSNSLDINPFESYNNNIKKLIPLINIYMGSEEKPSLTTTLNKLIKDERITNMATNILSMQNSVNTINTNMNVLQNNINSLQTNIQTAANSVMNSLSIVGSIQAAPATAAMSLEIGKSYQYVLTCKDEVMANDYTTNKYTVSTSAIHNPISVFLLERFPNRCRVSNLSVNFPLLPAGTFALDSSEGLMLGLVGQWTGTTSINAAANTITNRTAHSRNTEYPIYATTSIPMLISYINAVSEFCKRTKNSQIYCIKASIEISKPIANIPALPARLESTKSVQIKGPSSNTGIHSGLTIEDPLNVSKSGIYLPDTTPYFVNFGSKYNPSNNIMNGFTFAYCQENSYMCGMGLTTTTGAASYTPICCPFNS